MHSYARLGIFGILALVTLRVGIGWHFYMEGASKIRSRDFSSEGFVKSAKGPLAENFQALIWDRDGRLRLNENEIRKQFAGAASQASQHFGLTAEQGKDLEKLKKITLDKLTVIYDENGENIYKHLNSFERFKKMETTPMWNKVASLRGQKEKVEAESLQAVQPALKSIDSVWALYELQLNAIATPVQRQSAGRFVFARPNEGTMNLRLVDRIIPIFDITIGICLLLGFMTPIAAGLGAAFMLSVVLSQMPGFPGTQPTYFQAVECLALVVLMTNHAGRYAGLDFLPWAWWHRAKEPA